METKIFNGVRIYKGEGYTDSGWCCNFKDYIEARNKQNRQWTEKSFCDWCEKHGFSAIG
jgi:hypothetical protein